MSRPRVSVVIPCYNYGRYLPQCVQSVLSQAELELEVIIVDDHSTDGSEKIAFGIAREHSEVRVIRNEVNKRHIATYNIGLAAATGDYIVLLSADDILAKGSLARAVALMEAHPNVAFVYGYAPEFVDFPDPAPLPRTWTIWNGFDWIRAVARRGDNVIVNPEVVMRGSVMRKLVGYDPAHPHAADFLLWLQAATLGDVGRVNGVQAHYRTHPGQMHLTSFAGIMTDMRERTRVYRDFLTGCGRSAGRYDAEKLFDLASGATAREALWRSLLAELGGRDRIDADAKGFADLAREIFPAVQRTLLWSELGRWHRKRSARVPASLLKFIYRVKWAIKWRIWRSWGI